MEAPIPYDAAVALIRGLPKQTSDQVIAIGQAIGRTLAQNIPAPYPSPLFTNSSMDGYAVRFSEISSGVHLKVIGRILAGAVPWTNKIDPGQCVKIMTGATIPDDCDTIVPVERVSILASDIIRISEAPAHRGQYVRHCGEDYLAGAILLNAGQQLTSLDVLTLAAAGINDIPVLQTPDLTLWQTGDEIIPPGTAPKHGQVFNASANYLSVLAKQSAITLTECALIPDQPDIIRQRLEQKLLNTHPNHILLTTGAVSRGDTDFVPGLAAEFGYRTLFHRVAIKPGKPIFLAHHPKYGFWFGLPGNPISTFVTWHCFVRPLLYHVFGVGSWTWQSRRLLQSAKCPPELTGFFRGVATNQGVTLANEQGSAHHSGSLGANVIVRCEGFKGQLHAGQSLMTLDVTKN